MYFTAEMNLKRRLKALKNSDLRAGRFIYNALKLCNHLVKLLFNGAYRAVYVTNRKFGACYYQRSNQTQKNRYPLLFSHCAGYLKKNEAPFILSFGCSTGEEVFTLGEYLPDAHIMGADINAWCIKQCKKKYKGPRFSFKHSLSSDVKAAMGFDAIFCLAVFQRTENRTDTSDIAQGLTFGQFEREILMLDEKLKPNGLFIIDHTDFSFTDTICSDWYQPLNFKGNQFLQRRPLFGRDNKKISEVQNNYRVFVKKQGQNANT